MYPWQEQTFNALMQQYYASSLHHGLLVKSTQGMGIEHFSVNLAKSMLCQDRSSPSFCGQCKSCHLLAGQVHPDFHEVYSDKPTIGVDLVRQLIDKIQKTSQLGGSKVIVINQIENMTEAASNAFLKTLEEPTPETFIIMSTVKPDGLLATIKSRCEQITLPIPSYEQSCQFISERGVTVPSKEVLDAYANSPLRYIESLENGALTYAEFSEDLQLLMNNSVDIAEFTANYGGHEGAVFDWLYHTITNVTAQAQSSRAEDNSIDSAELIALYDWIDKTLIPAKQKLLHQGINKTLLMKTVLGEFRQCQNLVLKAAHKTG